MTMAATNDEMKGVRCPETEPKIENAALSHTNRTKTTTIEAIWNPPENFQGKFVIKGTVLTKFDTFWVGLTSEGMEAKLAPSVTTHKTSSQRRQQHWQQADHLPMAPPLKMGERRLTSRRRSSAAT